MLFNFLEFNIVVILALWCIGLPGRFVSSRLLLLFVHFLLHTGAHFAKLLFHLLRGPDHRDDQVEYQFI